MKQERESCKSCKNKRQRSDETRQHRVGIKHSDVAIDQMERKLGGKCWELNIYTKLTFCKWMNALFCFLKKKITIIIFLFLIIRGSIKRCKQCLEFISWSIYITNSVFLRSEQCVETMLTSPRMWIYIKQKSSMSLFLL
jgi:hypothetical protein